MPNLQHFLEDNIFIFVPVAFAWLATVAIASVLFRRSRGKGVFTTVPEEALFVEKRASGRSLHSFVTKIGGARNCLLVAVTHNTLEIHPHFPFTLLFLPEVYGLDWSIPKSAISRVESVRGLFGKERIQVAFDLAQRLEKIELELRSPDGFLAALRK